MMEKTAIELFVKESITASRCCGCPQATTDGNGEIEIEFYTSDISSVFNIVCLGCELNGNGFRETNESIKVIF